MSNAVHIFGRRFRDFKAILGYPAWRMKGEPAPDNHWAKKMRIRKIARKFSCDTFIETGTFYGQMVNFALPIFSKVMSVEVYEPLYKKNTETFAEFSKAKIFFGNSADQLGQMISQAEGRILFWLDGHYSGSGTGCADQVSPILAELDVIRASGVEDSCILIDDARLFNGKDGYPLMDETIEKLNKISSKNTVCVVGDCILCCPGN